MAAAGRESHPGLRFKGLLHEEKSFRGECQLMGKSHQEENRHGVGILFGFMSCVLDRVGDVDIKDAGAEKEWAQLALAMDPLLWTEEERERKTVGPKQ